MEDMQRDWFDKVLEFISASVNQGLEQAHGTGYGGSGFKFNEEEDEVRKAAKKSQAKNMDLWKTSQIPKMKMTVSERLVVTCHINLLFLMTNTVLGGQVLPNGGLPDALVNLRHNLPDALYATPGCCCSCSCSRFVLAYPVNIGGLLTTFASAGCIIWLFGTPVYQQEKRIGLLMASGALHGASISPLIEAAKEARFNKEAVLKFFHMLIRRRYFSDELPPTNPWSTAK